MKKSFSTKVLLLLLLLALVGGGIGTYLWFKPVDSIESLSTDLTIPANDLFIAFESDEAAANEQYLNKVIEVTGVVKEVKTNDMGLPAVILETDDLIFGVMCEFEKANETQKIEVGELVTIKGVCTGKLLDVVLNRSILIN